MDTKFGLTLKSYQDMQGVFKKFTKVERVLIFGSRAMGTQRNGSDIDLALLGDTLAFEDIGKIRVELAKLPYAYTYDILIYNLITNPAVKEHIDDKGVGFYTKRE